jgi:hypothetical protein
LTNEVVGVIRKQPIDADTCVTYGAVMKKPRIQPLVIAACSVVLLIVAMQASPVKAGYPDECAGSADLGLANTVGVPDVGAMVGGEPTVPKEMIIYRFTGVLGEYSLRRYLDGEGLIRPTDSMPVWLATVDGPGTFLIIRDGESCVVAVEASIGPQPSGGPLPSSDPSVPGSDTIEVPKDVALTGIGALALLMIAGYLIRRRLNSE